MIHTATVNAALDRELAVPQFTSDEVLRASEVRVDWDGNGFNVSWALFALGIRTDLVQTAGQIRINVSIVTEDHAH